ncbi:MAG TPA: hypothetical protein V6D33_12190 [Cyanophyceae cyanobacterium]
MIIFSNPNLPKLGDPPNISEGAMLCQFNSSNSTEVTHQAILFDVGISGDVMFTTSLPHYLSYEDTVDIPLESWGLDGVDAVEIAGYRYTRVAVPEDLVPQTFFWNEYTGVLTVKFSPAVIPDLALTDNEGNLLVDSNKEILLGT